MSLIDFLNMVVQVGMLIYLSFMFKRLTFLFHEYPLLREKRLLVIVSFFQLLLVGSLIANILTIIL